MPYLHRHRTICAVLQEIRDRAIERNDARDVVLCDEALTYARSMSDKLTKYKEKANVRQGIHTRD
jgi:hypothetical protein